MRESPPKVITIPAKPEAAAQQTIKRQLRVAAYCRVSTDDEEQLTSYEAQQNYYTDKIMTNCDWTMEQNTVTTRPRWMRNLSSSRSSPLSIPS